MSQIISTFISKEYEIQVNNDMLLYAYSFPYSSIVKYINDVISLNYTELIEFVTTNYQPYKLQKSEFMQFSSVPDATNRLCAVLIKAGDPGLQADMIGKYLLGVDTEKKHEAYRKYGEGHAKTAVAMGLLSESSNYYFLSCLGFVINDLHDYQQKELLSRLVFRMPEYRQLFVEITVKGSVNLREYMGQLTDSTYLRRRSSFKNLLKILSSTDNYDFSGWINRINIQ